jgi:GDPmannose 4,6-dehydratase
MHASSGILYNHESPRRGFEYVTQKVATHAARIKLGLCKELTLGNLEAARDWGHARDFVRAMWLMLQQEKPGDYVIATGKTHTVRELVEKAFGFAGLDAGKHLDVDPKFYREGDVNVLCGDASLARHTLGWSPEYDFDGIIREMVEAALQRESETR